MATGIQSRDLQEDLLTLLVFDDQYGRILSGLLQPEYFDVNYQEIVGRSIRFIQAYKEAPKDSLPTLLDDKLSSDDEAEAQLYKDTLSYLFQSKQGVQAKYTLSRLEAFVRSRQLKDGVLQAAQILNKSQSDEAMDSVERILLDASKSRMSVFDAGTRLTDLEKSLSFLDKSDGDILPTGIKHLDQRKAAPIRGGLFLFIAMAKAGKSWALMHLGKIALVNRLSVVHITLEMDEASVAMRYIQSFFGVGVREKIGPRTKFELDDLGDFIGIDVRDLNPELHLHLPDIKNKLSAKITKRGMRMNDLIIKQFPTGGLTIQKLNAYLDLLADSARVKPDLLIVDYADLMRVSMSDYRLSLGNLYKELRGIAVERNMAIATASQANRGAGNRRQVDATDVAEDWSKIATADVVITYTQSEAEKSLNLARLKVAANRNEEGGFTSCISQHYETGQFCIDSIRLQPQYFGFVEDTSNIEVSQSDQDRD